MHRELTFAGYWPITSAEIAPWPGIYCVYATVMNTTSYLLYIGESINVGQRVYSHERVQQWVNAANGHPLCYSSSMITLESERKRIEAAMIYQHKPPCNSDYKLSFPYPTTSIVTAGMNANLEYYFTVHPQ